MEQELQHTLSTGVKVVFNKLSRQKSQELVVATFKASKLDKKGNLTGEDASQNLKTADNLLQYHNTLIANGVTLVGKIEDYSQIDSKWLKKLQRSNFVNIANFDLTDEDDVVFLFLRYEAFVTEEDWKLLSEQVLNTEQ